MQVWANTASVDANALRTAFAYFTRSRELYQQIGLAKDVQEEEALIAEVKEIMSKGK